MTCEVAIYYEFYEITVYLYDLIWYKISPSNVDYRLMFYKKVKKLVSLKKNNKRKEGKI